MPDTVTRPPTHLPTLTAMHSLSLVLPRTPCHPPTSPKGVPHPSGSRTFSPPLLLPRVSASALAALGLALPQPLAHSFDLSGTVSTSWFAASHWMSAP